MGEVKERGIIFNAEMARAILDGRKTQTRRLMKVQPPDGWGGVSDVVALAGHCPIGTVGDRLWVRETWSTHKCFDGYKPSELSQMLSLHYWADGDIQTGKKRPSIHMPRWASRIMLGITGVRVERLQDITIGDICKEGMAHSIYEFVPVTQAFPSFEHYWRSLHGEGSWKANPWVWVVEFKVIEIKGA